MSTVGPHPIAIAAIGLITMLALVACGDSADAPSPTPTVTATPEVTETPAPALTGDPARLCEIDDEFGQIPDISQLEPAEARETGSLIRALLDESVEVAPAEIRETIEAVRAGRQSFFAVLEDAGFDLSAVDQDAYDAAVAENFISGATARADERWERWNATNCS